MDLCFDKNSKWRVVEVNTKGITIRFSQYGGKPFFGDFTEEVIEYSIKTLGFPIIISIETWEKKCIAYHLRYFTG